MLPEYFEFTLPAKVVYGIGILKNIGQTVMPFGKRKALLVTDEVLVKTGLVDQVKAGFDSTNIKIACIFDEVPPNSTIQTVEKCAALGIQSKCDMVLAVGGGSVIDTAKVANILMVKGGTVADHMGAYLLEETDELLPMIIIPTTAGTGSEVTKVAVIADLENAVKLPFAEEQFLPKLAILDPELTVSMPGKLTAATGMDALTHAIEAYVGKEHSPASDALALHAISIINNNILLACAHPDNLQARGAVLVGSFLAGVAFSHSMPGMTHSIAHALGGIYHIPHGIANALVLPEVMEYNMEAEPERYADIAVALGVSFPQLISQGQSLLKSGTLASLTRKFSPAYVAGTWLGTKTHAARGLAAKTMGNLHFVDQWVRKQAAQAGVERIRTLNRQLSYLTRMPLNLKEAGINDNLAKMDQLATAAMEDGSTLYNPAEPNREDIIRIIEKLYNSKAGPLSVAEEDLRPQTATLGGQEIKNVFNDTDQLHDVLLGFFEQVKQHPQIGPALLKSNLLVQFCYKNPAGVITVDARGDEVLLSQGEYDGNPEVTMTMNADFAHKFWHGKANLLTALTRRQVIAKGNVPKTVKLLPILNPAFDLYPKYLKERGLEDLVM